ncbi:hypothetical protein ACJMK2_016876 [Sinanodonta woodiana]|uniref:Uncharacterized protein n=1 Tax=Sinanodonta woodiana TaxID=1069815 RepID=A0ABD3UXS6_SINWO
MYSFSPLIVFVILFSIHANVEGQCPTRDCVLYNISTQAICTDVTTKSPTSDCRWAAGLNINVDQVILQGRIVAYKIQWYSGSWSDWYVPGINDIDSKYNPSGRTCSISYNVNSMRRMWSYFYDHFHKYIICYTP